MEKKKTKRFYWMKLTEDFMFSKNGPLDFLMTSSPNGAKYVVLYQMLCLQTINTGGVFVTDYGDVVVKLTVEKIRQNCKYFSPEEIVVALELYKQIGLVAEDKNGFLEIKGHDSLIGSECSSASRMRRLRLKEEAKALEKATENMRHIECHNVTYRDKETKDIRDTNNLDNSINIVCIDNLVSMCTDSMNSAVTNDTHTTTLGKYKNVIVPLDWLEKFKATYGQGYANLVIERLSLYKEAHSITKQNDVPYLERFAEEDKAKQNDANSTFDADDFFEAALKRSYEQDEED